MQVLIFYLYNIIHKSFKWQAPTQWHILICWNYVVENATRKHDVRNHSHVPLATWIPNDAKMCLLHSKTTLTIFARRILSFNKVFAFLITGLMDALNKSTPLWIYFICQQVVSVVLFFIHIEGKLTSLASEHVKDQWRTVKHIEVIIWPRKIKENMPYM